MSPCTTLRTSCNRKKTLAVHAVALVRLTSPFISIDTYAHQPHPILAVGVPIRLTERMPINVEVGEAGRKLKHSGVQFFIPSARCTV